MDFSTSVDELITAVEVKSVVVCFKESIMAMSLCVVVESTRDRKSLLAIMPTEVSLMCTQKN